MSPFTRRAFILAALMMGASMLSVALTPTKRVTVGAAQFDLESIIPRQFGDWRVDERIVQAVVNPQAQAVLDSVYSQILSRTYINSNGRRIMLSLAYGADQSHETQIHKPEVCYPAQGFLVARKEKGFVRLESIDIPVMRLTTRLGDRHEPVTYWIRIGNDSLARGVIEQNIARIKYGLQGLIPDGILFRVSEINPDIENSFGLQDQFIQSLLPSLTPDAYRILLGRHGKHSLLSE